MAQLTIENFTGGLAPNFYFNNTNLISQVQDGGFAFALNCNPYVDIGVLTPGSTKAALTNVASVSSSIVQFEFDDNTTKVYGLEKGTKLHQINVPTDTIANSGVWPHTITASGSHAAHTGIGGASLAWYTVNGNRRLFYAWNDATDGDVGTYDLVTTFNDNALSGSTNGAALSMNPHPLLVAENGFLYIPDGNNIHKFDGSVAGGSAGTMTASVIDVDKNFIFLSSMDYNGYGYFAAVRTFTAGANISNLLIPRPCVVYVWDYTSVQSGNNHGFYKIYKLDKATYVYKLLIYEGTPAVIVHGIDNTVQLRLLVGSEPRLLQSFPSGAGPCVGGISGYKAMLMWIGSGSVLGGGGNGLIYTLGSPKPFFYGAPTQTFSYPTAANQIQGTAGTAGALISVDIDKYYVSENGANISKFSVGTRAILNNGAYWLSKVYAVPKKSRIKGINIYWPTVTSTDNVNDQFDLYVNNGTSAILSKTLNDQTYGSQGFVYIPFDKTDVNYIQCKWTWSTSLTNITTCIRPSRFEIIYEPTTKII